MGTPKDLGARRYTLDIAHVMRCRAGILLDSKIEPATAIIALRQIDALAETLAQLKRQRDTDAKNGDDKASIPTIVDR